MRKWEIIFLFSFLVAAILISGCSAPQEYPSNNFTADNVTAAVNETNEPAVLNKSITPTGPCLAQWKCISSKYKAYRKEDCSWGERKECPLGCFNDTCRAASTCTTGFKCINSNMKGYQTEGCTWISKTTCEWGCVNNKCQPKPNASQETPLPVPTKETTPQTPKEEYPELHAGIPEVIIISGEKHDISIYIIEADRVKVLLDSIKSDWLEEDDKYAYPNGLTITVKAIYFQNYYNGTKAIDYIIE